MAMGHALLRKTEASVEGAEWEQGSTGWWTGCGEEGKKRKRGMRAEPKKAERFTPFFRVAWATERSKAKRRPTVSSTGTNISPSFPINPCLSISKHCYYYYKPKYGKHLPLCCLVFPVLMVFYFSSGVCRPGTNVITSAFSGPIKTNEWCPSAARTPRLMHENLDSIIIL